MPTEPERFGRLLEPFRTSFGEGFHQRAQEAVRCYGAHAYLACCAMCGAATESILLAVAIEKSGNAEEVMRTYLTANGRYRVENSIIGQSPEHLQREFRGFTALLKYWRDASAHGGTSSVGDNEAYTSIALLLRYASFTQDNWGALTGG